MSKEHNFVSAVVYLHNCAGGITSFLSMLQGQLDANFERYEIVCVNDASADDSAEKARSFARERDFPLTLVQMSAWQGLEPAMTAGIDIAIGDFVFEFDNVEMPYAPELLMECYRKALQGSDIVQACPRRCRPGWHRMFYRLFNHASDSLYPVREDAFRLISRRALNRVHSISSTPPYRKAAYAASGLRMATVEFDPAFITEHHDKDPFAKALDSLALYTNMFYRVSVGIAMALLAITIFLGIYTLVIYLSPVHQVAGWTSIMLVMCLGFFGIFLMLSIVIKYLSLLVDLVFKKQRYLVESIEKIQK